MTTEQQTLLALLADLRSASDATTHCAVHGVACGRAGLETALARIIAGATRVQSRLGLDNERIVSLALAQLESHPLSLH